MVRSGAALVALVALMGCADGKVKTDAVDFGKVKSATWVERILTDEAGDEHRHDFVLATHSGWCRFANDVYPTLGASWADVLTVIQDNPDDVTAQCEAKQAFYEEAAGLTDKVFKDGLSVMHIALRDPNEDASVKPFIGPYPIVGFDEVDRYIVGGIQRYDVNPYRLYADEADCENKATFWESDARDKLEGQSGEWTLSDGSGEVQDKGTKAFQVTIDGTLDDRSGKAAGEVSIKGTFEYCELIWEGDFPELL